MQPLLTFVIWWGIVSAAWAAQAAGSQCSLAPQQQHLSKVRGVGSSCVTHCLLDHLGQPQTEAERLLTYLTAMSEYCAALSSDLALCHSEPLCQVMLLAGNATVQVESDPARATAADWWQVLTERTRQECWPDWLSILNQECPGSKHAQVKHCLGTREERAANAELRQSYRYGRKKENWACPKGCMTVYLERHVYPPAPTCLPPWMLHQVCGSRYCAAGDQQQGAPEDAYCKVKQALSDGSAKHENKTCSAAVAYATSTSMGDFQGSCPHRLAVAQLLKAVPEIFAGHGGCSVQPWLSEPPGLCDMWPPPSFAYDAFPAYGNGSVHQLWTPQTLTQAALLRCVSGVQRMHNNNDNNASGPPPNPVTP